MRSFLHLIAMLGGVLALSGCNDAARISDEDADRIAEKTAKKVMDRLLDKGSDDLAYRLHQKLRDLDRAQPAAEPSRPAARAPTALDQQFNTLTASMKPQLKEPEALAHAPPEPGP